MSREICFINTKIEKVDVYFDNQALTCGSAVRINNALKTSDPLTECEISTLNNTKTEICPSNIKCNESTSMLNLEDILVTKSAFIGDTSKIKLECENNYLSEEVFFPENTSSQVYNNEICDEVKVKNEVIFPLHIGKQLFCQNCHENYEGYCIKCRMLIHILDRNVFINTNNKARAEIPRNMLEMRESSGHVGIFALKFIPKGVTFGPFTGLNSLECFWKIKGGKFIVSDDKLKFLNWMQYIDNARSISQQNLLIFQCEGNLYYRSIHEIRVGDELLIYYGEEYEDSLNKDVEMRFIPPTEAYIETVFACIFCCLGFNSKVHLINHKTMCPNGSGGSSSIDDITQCLFCKMYMEQKEYLQYHMDYCYEKKARQCSLPAPDSQTINAKQRPLGSKKSKRQFLETYNCPYCKYKTKYKSDLQKHVNKHYEVKTLSCAICLKRFKRREMLHQHAISIHGSDVKQKEQETFLRRPYKCTKCEYETLVRSHFTNHRALHDEVKQLQHSDRDIRTKYKQNLKPQRLQKHRRPVQQLKCPQCDYVTHHSGYYKAHLGKHGSVKRFKCSECEYATDRKTHLKRHFYRHETVKRYKCLQCEYKTNDMRSLLMHAERQHSEANAKQRLEQLKKKRLKCDECGFRTNYERTLRAHTNAKHREINKYECSRCEFGTNYASNFNKHVVAKHGEQKKPFRCERCDFATSYMASLRRHMGAKNCKGGTVRVVDSKQVERIPRDGDSSEEIFGM